MATGWEDFLLSEQPQWAYFSAAPFTTSSQEGFSPAQQNYWRNQYSDVWSRYLGQVGGDVRTGEEAIGGFQDYLSDMPWNEMYYQASPAQRGMQQGRYNPSTRYIY
tara:strand:+ start:122 stop:439 length:318 start_codon:yes stop_codon:yes gene_type:complete